MRRPAPQTQAEVFDRLIDRLRDAEQRIQQLEAQVKALQK
jgi:hypothetical protein